MRVYVDLDVAVKLARWGLLTRFVTHMRVHHADLFTVATLRFRVKKPAVLKLCGSQAALNHLKAFADHCKLPTVHDAAVARALVGVHNIDVGEAALFAAAANFDAAICDTGDKRALRAVGLAAASDVALKPLTGKIACLEQTLVHLIDRWTYSTVATAVGSDKDADAFSTTCFGHGAEAAVRTALAKHIGDLVTAGGGIMAKDPFGWVT